MDLVKKKFLKKQKKRKVRKRVILLSFLLVSVFFLYLFFNSNSDFYSILNLQQEKELGVLSPAQMYYTDDNTGEDYIIKTDKEYYHGLSGADFLTTITNTQDKSECVFIKVTGNIESAKIKGIENITKITYSDFKCIEGTDENCTKWDYKINNYTIQKEVFNDLKIVENIDKKRKIIHVPEYALIPTTCDADSMKIGFKCYDRVFTDKYTDVELKEIEDITRNQSLWQSKLKPIGDEPAYNMVRLCFAPNETKELKIRRKRDKPSEEFYIEVFGDYGGYGHLDPFLTGGWSGRAKITIPSSKVYSNLTDFPVLLTNENLPEEMWNSSRAFHAKSDGCDIRFTTDQDGTNELAFEIVNFSLDNPTGSEIWVKLNLINTTDNIFYVWYANKDASCYAPSDTYGSYNVWTKYNYVSHDGGLNDSTINENDGTITGAITSTTGIIGTAHDFPGDAGGTRIEIPDDDSLSFQKMSVEVWFNPDTYTNLNWILNKRGTGATVNREYQFLINYGQFGGALLDDSTGGYIARYSNYTAPNNSWTFGAISYNGGTNPNSSMFIYINGSLKEKDGTLVGTYVGMENLLDPLLVGTSFPTGYTYPFDGKLDEIRLSPYNFSQEWFKTEYENINNYSGFATAVSESPESLYDNQTNWKWKANITIPTSKVYGNFTDFPVVLTEDNLPSNIFTYAKDDGCDLRFSLDENGTQELPFEIVSFDKTTNKTEIWVKMNLTNTTDNVFWVWYNNSNASCYWAGSYFGKYQVWDGWEYISHDGGATDSTSNGNNGTAQGGVSMGTATGKIGSATDFDGVDDYITTGYYVGADKNYTSVIWFNADDLSTTRALIGAWGTKYHHLIWRQTTSNTLSEIVWPTDTTYARIDDKGNFPTGSYQMVTMTYETGDALRMYQNDTFISSATSTSTGTLQYPEELWIGHDAGAHGYWDGIIDNIMETDKELSSDYIKTLYENYDNVSSFSTAGSPQQTTPSADTTPPYFTSIPANETITYGTNWAGVDFDATDDVALDSYSVNDSRFTINSTGYLDDAVLLGAGTYILNITINDTSGNENSTIYKLVVNKATGVVYTYLNNTRANITITNGTSIWLNGTLQTGSGTIYLYNNGTLINSGTSPLSNYTTFNTTGLYNITTIYSGNENYTSAYETWWVNVTEQAINDTTPPTWDNLRNFEHQVNTPFSEYITASDPSGIDMYWLNDTSVFDVNPSTGLITNITSLINVTKYTLLISVNDTYGNINTGEFYIDVVNVTTQCGTSYTTLKAQASNKRPYGRLCYWMDFR